ncbi:MAG TPA: hypothetical protein VFI37_12825 [Gaiellaceae bacterium]|nr:hypothetical protein [Gaiellaceae bacterium]
MIPPELAALAESPDAHTELAPGFERVLTDRYAMLLGPTPHFTSVQRLRIPDGEVESTVEEVRGHVRARGHTNAVWWIGGSTTPTDLDERLAALGFRPPGGGARHPELVALATATPPAPGPADLVARAVETVEEHAIAMELQWDAFDVPKERRAVERLQTPERFRDEPPIAVRFLAWVDGRPAAAALGVFAPAGCLLVAGATAEWARGRGAYRALVRARWDEAVRRGTPGLAVAAAPTSEPILRRLGFEEVARLRRLEDPAT